MHVSQTPYRTLTEAICEYKGVSLFSDILAPWVNANSEERDWLRSLSRRRVSPIPPVEPEESWRLYALSRVNQLLLLAFQRGRADGSDWRGPQISLDEYTSFAESLGLSPMREQRFTPLFHEIVQVDQSADPQQPIVVHGFLWPCLMIGSLVLSRAGVRVLGGSHFIVNKIAEGSTLYWAFRRKNRPYQDLSHGWGSNSQWRTSFRRDYLIDQIAYYNVDGNNDLCRPKDGEPDRDGLARAERIELLTNRCFVKAMQPHDDLWPYDDAYHAPLWEPSQYSASQGFRSPPR